MKGKITEDIIIKEFSKRLRKKLKGRIKKIILFGSKARGDWSNTSDYDFLIVVDKRDKEIQEEILDESSALSSDNDELIGSIIWEENELDYKFKFPIGLNIKKEGIEL